jgi:hypothetical protein
MNEIQITCLSCGHTWKVKRDTTKQYSQKRTYSGADIPKTAMYKCDCGWSGNLQYGKAFCYRCNKQLNDSHIVTDYHAFEKKIIRMYGYIACSIVDYFGICVFLEKR